MKGTNMKNVLKIALGLAALVAADAARAGTPHDLNGIYETADGKLLAAEGVLNNDSEALSLMIKDSEGNDREFRAMRGPEVSQTVPFVYIGEGCVVTFTPYTKDGKHSLHAEAVPDSCAGDKDFKGYKGEFTKREGAAAEQPWPM